MKSEDFAQPVSKADDLSNWLELDLPSNKQIGVPLKKVTILENIEDEQNLIDQNKDESSESNR